MSENPSPQTPADSQSMSHLGNLEGVSQLLTNESAQQQTTLALDGEPMDVWEAVDVATGSVKDIDESQTLPEGPISEPASKTISRETELLALIHDLNECNDTLLSRTALLERELNATKTALTAATEQTQAAQNKMLKQVSAEHASAQQVSQNAQQQVAKLVEQLDVTEQSLSRQQLVNENLQTELDNAQERIAQIERDAALMAQQHAEQAQARVAAENTSRDLRSRLQRQQRYTLQFKAALEKSLTVSTRPIATTNSVAAEAVRPMSFQDVGAVAMPKARRIMPWAAGSATAFQGIDPHLETLIRGVNKSNEPAPAAPTAESEAATPVAASPEAEAKLWQDLERVINTDSEAIATEAEVTDAKTEGPEIEVNAEANNVSETVPEVAATEVAVSKVDDANPDEIDLSALSDDIPAATRVSGPTLNWQANRQESESEAVEQPGAVEQPEKKLPESPALSAAAEKETIAEEKREPAQEVTAAESAKDRRDAIALAEALATAAKRRSDPAIAFTEPSPWGNPLPEKIAQPAAVAQTNVKVDSQDYLPAMEPASGLSPVVKPLRSQKKIGSLASVELPTFPKAKVGSFKR